jgi:hypothetical protein
MFGRKKERVIYGKLAVEVWLVRAGKNLSLPGMGGGVGLG